MAALQLKDLIQAQQKLKQQENIQQERMTVEEFRKLASSMGEVEQTTANSQKTLKEGLTATEGDGLNSNVIKLTEALKEQTKLTAKSAEPAPVIDQAKAAETLETRSKEQAGRYVPGTKDFIKNQVGFEMPKAGSGLKGWGESFKKMFSLESMLDMSEGKNMGGLFGGQLRRKVEENKYVEDRMATEKGRMLNLPKYQGEEGKKAAEEVFRRQYKEQTNIRGSMAENEKQIAGLRDRGFSEADIKRSKAFEQRETLDKSMRDVNVQYRDQRKADDKAAIIPPGEPAEVIPISKGRRKKPTDAFATPLNTAPTTGPLAAAVTGLVGGGEEQQSENLRMMVEQNETLKRIEENTRGVQKVGTQPPSPAAQQQSGEGGGSLLGDIADLAGDFLGKGKKGMGKVAGRAGGMLSKASGFIGRNAGKLGAIGGIAMGAYDAYQGWSEADKMKEAGLITEDEADIKKSEAVGGGVGGAGGAMAGAAAGAAIGSVVPVVGTAIGGLIGGTLGYMGGSAVGKTVGEYGAKAWKGVKGFFGGGDENQAEPEKKASMGDKLWSAAKMAIPGVGVASALFGGVRGKDEVISPDAVKDQTNKDLSGKVGVTMADQMVSSKQNLVESSTAGPGGEKTSRDMTQGVTAQKSLFGSTTLGTLFSKKGQEIGNFLGQGSSESEDNGKVTAKYGSILGKRVSGGLLGSDTYTASLEGKDGSAVYDEKFSKSQYMEMQKLAGEGKYDEAEAKFRQFKEANAKATGMAPEPTSAESVYQKSGENAAAAQQPAVVSAPTTVIAPTTNNQQTQNIAQKGGPRNSESAYQAYNRSRFVF